MHVPYKQIVETFRLVLKSCKRNFSFYFANLQHLIAPETTNVPLWLKMCFEGPITGWFFSFPLTDVVNVPQPISTPGLYYTNALCFVPNTATCAESQTSDPSLIYKSFKQTDCNHPNNLFVLEKNGDLKHHCSGKIVCADSKNYFSLKTTCPNNRGKFERLAVRIYFHKQWWRYSKHNVSYIR